MKSSTVKRLIVLRNMAYFKQLLEAETDPDRRAVIQRLLAREEAELIADDHRDGMPWWPRASSGS